jgi:hypothetical protein
MRIIFRRKFGGAVRETANPTFQIRLCHQPTNPTPFLLLIGTLSPVFKANYAQINFGSAAAQVAQVAQVYLVTAQFDSLYA